MSSRKPIPIQGTNLNLDKPEDLEAWIAERKRRWPTAPRVDDKKRKMEEAIARGQLPDHLGSKGNKRQRIDGGNETRHGDRGRGRGNPTRERARTMDSGWQGRVRPTMAPTTESQRTLPPSTLQVPAADSTDIDTEDDDDETLPEAVSSKAPVYRVLPDTEPQPAASIAQAVEQDRLKVNRQLKRPPPQPKKEPHNPFASRPTLLRNACIVHFHAIVVEANAWLFSCFSPKFA